MSIHNLWPFFLLTISWFMANSSFGAPMNKPSLSGSGSIDTTLGNEFNRNKRSKTLSNVLDVPGAVDGSKSPIRQGSGSPSPSTSSMQPEFKMGDEITFTSNLENIKKVSIIGVPKIGSSAIVYKVQDPAGLIFAFKYFTCVKNQKTFSSELEKRKCAAEPHSIENEIRALKHLKRFVQSGEYKEKRYILMAFVDGKTIDNYVDNIVTKEQIVSFKESARVAIADLHRKGVAHNDIHPGNILFTVNNEGIPVASIIDFGLSTLLNEGVVSVENADRIRDDFVKLATMISRLQRARRIRDSEDNVVKTEEKPGGRGGSKRKLMF